MNKKIAGVAVAAALMGAGATMATTPMTAFAADTTTDVTADATKRSPGQWVSDALKGLVDKGTITQAQSDEVSKALEAARPQGGPGGPGGPGGHHGGGRIELSKAAEVLGVSEDDLKTALRENKSIATIAKEKNVDVQKVIDALVAAENTRIDQAVTDGKLTKEQADTRKANTVERVTNMVNNVRPVPPRPRGGGDEQQPPAKPSAA